MHETTSFLDGRVTLHAGDCLAVMASMPDNSVDAVTCDAPYHLTSIVERFGAATAAEAQHGTDGAFARAARGFMGKEWDGGDIAFRVETWAHCLRILKPGGHLVAFGGTRTSHRMAVAIEDAGFEIRDQLAWCYGSGFPKSHSVSLAFEKRICVEGKDDEDRTVWFYADDGEPMRTTPPYRDADANEWAGWGTALKPAWEPIVLARKPLGEKSVMANVLAWLTGAIHVGACRIGTGVRTAAYSSLKAASNNRLGDPAVREARRGLPLTETSYTGRYPANIVHDGSPEVVAAFPDVGLSSGGKGVASQATALAGHVYGTFSGAALGTNAGGLGDSGSAARFFYSAKTDADDRHGSNHPTVKPVDLMRWLVRLVCRKGGTVLDPFAGTGTTGEAAYWEGCNAVLIEREPEYQADIAKRMGLVLAGPDEKKRARTKLDPAEGLPLFGAGPAVDEPSRRGRKRARTIDNSKTSAV